MLLNRSADKMKGKGGGRQLCCLGMDKGVRDYDHVSVVMIDKRIKSSRLLGGEIGNPYEKIVEFLWLTNIQSIFFLEA